MLFLVVAVYTAVALKNLVGSEYRVLEAIVIYSVCPVGLPYEASLM